MFAEYRKKWQEFVIATRLRVVFFVVVVEVHCKCGVVGILRINNRDLIAVSSPCREK